MSINGIRDKFINLLLFLVNLSIIYSFNTFYFDGNRRGQIVSLVIIVVSFLTMWGLKPSVLIDKKIFTLFLIYIAIAIIIIIKSDFSWYSIFMMGLAFPCCMFFMYYIICENYFKLFITIFCNIVVVIAIISIFFWLFGSILHIIQPSALVYSKWSNQFVASYYNLYFQPQNADYTILNFTVNVRNSAIFLESPMATYIFGVSIIINELFIKKKFVRVILLIALISTADTTAIIFFIIYMIYIITMYTDLKLNSIWGIVALILIISVIPIFIKVLQSKASSGLSLSIRINHIIQECKAFLLSPIYGQGFNEFTNGSSNSIFALSADGGILLWGIYYFPLFSILKKSIKSMKIIILLFIILFAITVVQYTLFTYMIISFVWIILNSNLKLQQKYLGE